jgi:hypothetical protein
LSEEVINPVVRRQKRRAFSPHKGAAENKDWEHENRGAELAKLRKDAEILSPLSRAYIPRGGRFEGVYMCIFFIL